MNYFVDEEKINVRLKSDFDLVSSLGYTCLGVFLQGSQNYGVSYKHSDIDTKAIVLPNLKDIILNRKPVSTTYILDSDEHVDIKDIRLMFECFLKQNINFLEILFTDYCYINPEYERFWFPILYRREDIAHYNNYKAVSAFSGTIIEKHKIFEHPYPSKASLIENYGYNPKEVHHMVRCLEVLRRYIFGESFKACLKTNDRDYLIALKQIPPKLNLDEARKLADECKSEAIKIRDNYMATTKLSVDTGVERFLENCLYEIISHKLEGDIKANELRRTNLGISD